MPEPRQEYPSEGVPGAVDVLGVVGGVAQGRALPPAVDPHVGAGHAAPQVDEEQRPDTVGPHRGAHRGEEREFDPDQCGALEQECGPRAERVPRVGRGGRGAIGGGLHGASLRSGREPEVGCGLAGPGGGMADAVDSKSTVREGVRVRVPPRAPSGRAIEGSSGSNAIGPSSPPGARGGRLSATGTSGGGMPTEGPGRPSPATPARRGSVVPGARGRATGRRGIYAAALSVGPHPGRTRAPGSVGSSRRGWRWPP